MGIAIRTRIRGEIEFGGLFYLGNKEPPACVADAQKLSAESRGEGTIAASKQLGTVDSLDGLSYLEGIHPLDASAAGRKAAFRQP